MKDKNKNFFKILILIIVSLLTDLKSTTFWLTLNICIYVYLKLYKFQYTSDRPSLNYISLYLWLFRFLYFLIFFINSRTSYFIHGFLFYFFINLIFSSTASNISSFVLENSSSQLSALLFLPSFSVTAFSKFSHILQFFNISTSIFHFLFPFFSSDLSELQSAFHYH